MTNVAGLYLAELRLSCRYRLRSAGKTAIALRRPTKERAVVFSMVIPIRSWAPDGPRESRWKKRRKMQPRRGGWNIRLKNT